MLIAVVNKSTLVSDDQAVIMTGAVQQQLDSDFAPAWERENSDVVFYKAGRHPLPPHAAVVTILDTIEDVPAGILGLHTEAAGKPKTGFVAAAPSLTAGAEVLTGDYCVASVLSHEVLELAGDPSCSLWGADGRSWEYALELCDPVEAPVYRDGGGPVDVSNFVLPSWFDPDGVAPFDHLGLLTAPFTILPGGYAVRARQGTEASVFGATYPAWRRLAKLGSPVSRTSRRRARLFPV